MYSRVLCQILVAAASALAAVVLLFTTTAQAETTWPRWTVAVAGGGYPPGNFSAPNVGNVTAVIPGPGTSLTCPVSIATGAMRIGFDMPNSVAVISTLTFSGAPAPHQDKCNGPLGIKFKIVTSDSLEMWALGHSASGVIVGELRKRSTGSFLDPWVGNSMIKATLTGTDGCVATIGGPSVNGSGGVIHFSFTNSTDRLDLTGGNLRVTSANASCDPALLNVGESFSLSGSYQLNKDVTLTRTF